MLFGAQLNFTQNYFFCFTQLPLLFAYMALIDGQRIDFPLFFFPPHPVPSYPVDFVTLFRGHRMFRAFKKV